MVSVGVKLDRSIKELLECCMDLLVILARHHVVVVLPVMYLVQVFLYRDLSLNRLSHLLNDPTH